MNNSNETLLAYFRRLANEQPEDAEWSRGAQIMEVFVSLTEHYEPKKQAKALQGILEEAEGGSVSCGSAWTDMTLRIQNFAQAKGRELAERE